MWQRYSIIRNIAPCQISRVPSKCNVTGKLNWCSISIGHVGCAFHQKCFYFCRYSFRILLTSIAIQALVVGLNGQTGVAKSWYTPLDVNPIQYVTKGQNILTYCLKGESLIQNIFSIAGNIAVQYWPWWYNDAYTICNRLITFTCSRIFIMWLLLSIYF